MLKMYLTPRFWRNRRNETCKQQPYRRMIWTCKRRNLQILHTWFGFESGEMETDSCKKRNRFCRPDPLRPGRGNQNIHPENRKLIIYSRQWSMAGRCSKSQRSINHCPLRLPERQINKNPGWHKRKTEQSLSGWRKDWGKVNPHISYFNTTFTLNPIIFICSASKWEMWF